MKSIISFIVSGLLITGCAKTHYHSPPCQEYNKKAINEQSLACTFGAYRYIPKNRSHIRSPADFLAWTFLGNDDDGIYGEKPSAGHWTKEKISSKRAFLWWCRNPLHNFCFYVIGSADRPNDELTILKISQEESSFFTYSKQAKTVFAGESTSFFFGFHSFKPFLSLRLDYGRLFDFYIGWRERGNFGLKCVLAGRKKKVISSPDQKKKRIDTWMKKENFKSQ